MKGWGSLLMWPQKPASRTPSTWGHVSFWGLARSCMTNTIPHDTADSCGNGLICSILMWIHLIWETLPVPRLSQQKSWHWVISKYSYISLFNTLGDSVTPLEPRQCVPILHLLWLAIVAPQQKSPAWLAWPWGQGGNIPPFSFSCWECVQDIFKTNYIGQKPWRWG